MDKFKQTGTLSLKSRKNICCSACSKEFAIKDFSAKTSRQPFLLHCGHSICETCLQIKSSTVSYTCGQCRHITTFQNNPKTNELLLLNFYLIGYLTVNQSKKYEKQKNLSLFTPFDIDFNYSVKEPQKTVYVCEECSEPCSWFCEICATNFCDLCWIKVHSIAKSLMKHKKNPVQSLEENKENFVKKCSIHKTQNLEFFCEKCDIVVCSHCVLFKHQSHSLVDLNEKNMEMIEVVKSAAEGAEIIQKRMKQTLEKIKWAEADTSESSSYEEAEAEIIKNFARLHGILQLEEEKALKELRDAADAKQLHLSDLRTKLEAEIENVTTLLRNLEAAVKNPQTSDFMDFHKKLLDVKKSPSFLIPPQEDNDSLTVAFDESAVTSLQNYCTLNIPKPKIFELRCGGDLPDDYQIDPLTTDPSEIEEVSGFVGKREPDVSGSELFPVFFQKHFNIVEGRHYFFCISYIKNPGEFYVLINSQTARRDVVNKKSTAFASSSDQIPTKVSKDELYLVKYTDGKWYRGKILASDEEQETAFVFYLDYGNTEEVLFSRLRPTPKELMGVPPLAIKCNLFGCVPGNEDCYAEATEIMENLKKNCVAKMKVIKIHSDCLEVDLSREKAKGQKAEEVSSLMPSNPVGGRKKTSVCLKYPEPCLPAAGETLQVVITHVNSTSDFYVKRIDSKDSNEENDLSFVQNDYYSNIEKKMIQNPAVGMPCAALFPADQKWYRAKITNIPNKQKITVLYVDYGNEETIPSFSVRKLKNYFAKNPPMAIRCSLVETQPNVSAKNRSHVSFLLKSECQKGICKMRVEGRTKNKEKLKVFLYFEEDQEEICVNDLLCDPNYGPDADDRLNIFSGVENYLTYTTLPRNSGSNKNERRNKKKSLTNEFFKDRKKLSAQELRELYASEKLLKASSSKPEDTASERNYFVKDKFKIKVDILSAQSPSCIYVTFPTLEAVLTDLHPKLQEFYKDSEYVDSEWSEDTKCVVYSSGEWHRASVLKILPDNKVKLFLKDVAKECVEPMSSLRHLDDSFSSYGPCAVKCHLSGIGPAGKEWPGISCEFLQSKIEKYREFYMSKKGEIEDKSLPVEIWVQRVIPGGALEPTVKEWVTLNRLLVEQGVAIPIKSTIKLLGEFEKEVENYTSNEQETEIKNEEEEKEKESETFFPSLSFGWLPPEKLTSSEFIGLPTYIDHDANIYIRDLKDEDRLEMIRKALLEEYGNSKPAPEDHFWTPGQVCIAKYYLDNNWCRGVVLETKENLTYEVLFIDFGNVETCQASEMRKRIKMAEIPTLVHKFRLHGVSPISEGGVCSIEALDVLHGLIVEKVFKVNVLFESPDPEEPSLITLKHMESDIDVAPLLIAQGLVQPEPCHFLCCSDIVMESEVVDTEENSDETPSSKSFEEGNFYKSLHIPEDLSEFYVNVTNVESVDEVYGNLVNLTLPKELSQVLMDFEEMEHELMNKCPDLPELEEFEGQQFVFFSPKEKKWCRVEIEGGKGDETVCVFFVDYGYKEYLEKNWLRKCLKEWLEVPKMAVRFKLASVKKYPDIEKTVCVAALTKCLKETKLLAKVISRQENYLEVEFFKDGESENLAYEELIEDEFIYKTSLE